MTLYFRNFPWLLL